MKGFGCEVEPGKCFLDALETYSTPAILETSYLVHEPRQLTKVNKQLMSSFFLKDQLINDVRDYFGKKNVVHISSVQHAVILAIATSSMICDSLSA